MLTDKRLIKYVLAINPILLAFGNDLIKESTQYCNSMCVAALIGR